MRKFHSSSRIFFTTNQEKDDVIFNLSERETIDISRIVKREKTCVLRKSCCDKNNILRLRKRKGQYFVLLLLLLLSRCVLPHLPTYYDLGLDHSIIKKSFKKHVRSPRCPIPKISPFIPNIIKSFLGIGWT